VLDADPTVLLEISGFWLSVRFMAATDFTWPDVVIANMAIRINVAIVRIFIFMVTLSRNPLATI
jgi:hypothetical protein